MSYAEVMCWFRSAIYPTSRWLKILLASVLVASLLSCSRSEPPEGPQGMLSTSTPLPATSATPKPEPTGDVVFLSGTVSYDFVPHSDNGGLDYNAESEKPVRGVVVQLLDDNRNIVDKTVSDESGFYQFAVEKDTLYQVRVLASLQRQGTPGWEVTVVDNTDFDALYAMQGALLSSGDGRLERNLHAPSGWTGNAYSEDRVAAPFAILDSVYQVLVGLEKEGLDATLPLLTVAWSTENRPSPGEISDGDIDNSFYAPDLKTMFVLGSANNDTDEYDRSVIQHEFAHFLESVLSRSDSIGGNHSFRAQLDMRVAFSEGFANAFTGFYSGSGFYEDSSFLRQSRGFRFSLESDQGSFRLGWYSEGSVGNILFDISDDGTNEPSDTLALGYWPILLAMRSDQYRNNPALTSIYTFFDAFETGRTAFEIDALLNLKAEHAISGVGAYGVNEQNDGGVSVALPVYHELSSDGVVSNVCSRGDSDRFFNALDVRRFVRFSIPAEATYRIDIKSSLSNTGLKNPEAVLFRNGKPFWLLQGSSGVDEVLTRSLPAGAYVLEVYDFNNADKEATGGAACFDISARRL